MVDLEWQTLPPQPHSRFVDESLPNRPHDRLQPSPLALSVATPAPAAPTIPALHPGHCPGGGHDGVDRPGQWFCPTGL